MRAPPPSEASSDLAPARYVNLSEARARLGHLVDAYRPYYFRADPLAEEVVAAFSAMRRGQGQRMLNIALSEGIDAVPHPPRALSAFFEVVDEVPLWVDWEQVDRGGSLMLRSGPLGALVLMCYSLPMGYRSPDAIQPLLASGRLMDRAGRRLNETAKFVLQTCMPGGLQRYSEGFATTIRVRLMHAQMRRLLLQQGTWDSQSWGTPINQADMIGTNMLFTWIPLEGLRALGFRISAEEANDYVQLWRYSGHLSGIEPELLCATEEENRRMSDLIDTTMRRPNEDSYALTEALMDSIVSRASNPREEELARRLKPFLYGASRYFIGDERADSLRYPESSWGLALAGIRGAVASMERVRTNIPGAKRLAVRLGTKAWEQLVESGLDGIPATFGLPTELSRIVGLGRKPS